MADENNSVVISIELEDGSFQKMQLGLDRAIEKGAKDGAKKISKTIDKDIVADLKGAGENIATSVFGKFGSALTRIPPQMLAITGAAITVGAAIQQAFSFTLQAEKIQQVQNQFDVLAARASLSAGALKEAFLAASDGLIDDEEVMRAASRSLIELGDHAKDLPKIFEIARKAAKFTGGDISQAYETITRAIEAGNTKSLKNLNIIINQDDALKKFAKTQGGSLELITQQGRQQAVLNAVLEKGAANFKDLGNVGEVTENLQRLKVKLGEIGDTLTVKIGRAFQLPAGGLIDIGHGIANMVESLVPKVGAGSQALSAFRREANDLSGLTVKGVTSPITLDGSGGINPIGPEPSFNKDPNAASKAAAFQSQLISVRSQTLAIEEARAQAMQEGAQKQFDVEFAIGQRKQIIVDEFEAKFAANEANKDLSISQRAALRVELEAQRAAQISAIDEKLNAERVANNQKAMSMISSTLGNGLGQGMAAFGGALAQGKNGFAAFGKSVLATLGNLCVQMGQMFILVGMGMNAAGPLFGLSGGGAIAAGIGLSILGGALSAIGGGGGASPSGDTGGGVSAGGGGLMQTDSLKQAEAKKETQVAINIQGNVLDRRETGLAIVETLNEFFNTSDGRLVRTA